MKHQKQMCVFPSQQQNFSRVLRIILQTFLWKSEKNMQWNVFIFCNNSALHLIALMIKGHDKEATLQNNTSWNAT